MLPVSDRLAAVLGEDHELAVEVVLTDRDGQRTHLAHPDRDDGITAAGSVVQDAGQVARWWHRLTLTEDPGPALTETGAKVSIRRGARFSSAPGDWETTPCGVTWVTDIDRTLPGGALQVTAKSAEHIVAGDEFLSPRSSGGPTDATSLISQLIRETLPDASISVDTNSYMLVSGLVWDSGRWEAIDGDDASLSRGLGIVTAVDGTGTWRLRDPGTFDDAPALIITGQGDDATLLSAASTATRRPNVVVVESSAATDGAVRGIAADTNPKSPTWVDGPHRRYVLRVSSPAVTDAASAQRAAQARLAQIQGGRSALQLTALAHPGLEVATDVIAVDTPPEGDGPPVRQLHIADRISFDLWSRPMSVTTRAVGG